MVRERSVEVVLFESFVKKDESKTDLIYKLPTTFTFSFFL